MQSKADKVDGGKGAGKVSVLTWRPAARQSSDGNPGREAGLRWQESAEVIVPV
jgi:hypothetical protein